MKKLLLATAALVAAVNVNGAQAVTVEYYGGTVEFAKQIGKCYDEAPSTLRTWINNPQPKMVVVKDYATFTKLDGVVGFRAGTIKRDASPRLSALAMQGDPKRGIIRSLIVLEDRHPKPFNQLETCSVVIHEMMHLYDFRYGTTNAEKSGTAEMQKAFKEDLVDANAFYKKASKDVKKYIDGAVRHSMSSPQEAFAETGATIIYFHPQSGWYDTMSVIFPRMMTFVRAQLEADKIVAADHMGKAGAPSAAPIPADVPSGKVMSDLRQ